MIGFLPGFPCAHHAEPEVDDHESQGTQFSQAPPDRRNIWLMTDVEAIQAFLVRSGLAPQSVHALRPEFPRWVLQLHKKGITRIPDSPLTGEADATNLLTLLARQGSKQRNSTIEHELRNLTGIRPYKLQARDHLRPCHREPPGTLTAAEPDRKLRAFLSGLPGPVIDATARLAARVLPDPEPGSGDSVSPAELVIGRLRVLQLVGTQRAGTT